MSPQQARGSSEHFQHSVIGLRPIWTCGFTMNFMDISLRREVQSSEQADALPAHTP
jgi:hypothetical protein